MQEIFQDEFVTWRHTTPVGVKVEEVFGMESKSGELWRELARQIFCEMGEGFYREIDHYENGAPFISRLKSRISITHTDHLFVAAYLPKMPEQDLEKFNLRTAMGIDAEKLGRSQVLKIRSKFLSDEELKNIPEENVEANIIAWTSKEALYKAALYPGLDFRANIILKKLPLIQKESEPFKNDYLGLAILKIPEETGSKNIEMQLYSYESYGCCVTIALSNKCAKFSKH